MPSVQMFDHAYLSKVSGYVSEANSHAVPVDAETVVLNGNLLNIGGSGAALDLTAEGSYDGQVWQTIESTTVNLTSAPITKATAKFTVDFAYLRVRAVASDEATNDVVALFNAELVFSHQDN